MTTTDTHEVELEIEADEEADPGATREDSTAAEAFARLEGEMAMMRRAVQQLAAERADIVIPDYNPTLVKMAANLSSLDSSLKAVEQSPALLVTPEYMGERIERVAHDSCSHYESTIQHWRKAADGLERDLSDALGSALRHDAQVKRQWQFFGIGAAVAALLMTFFPGTIARAVPDSWLWPERMAKRTLGAPSIMDAGIIMIRSASPQTWEQIVAATNLVDGNQTSFQRCKAKARKAKRKVDCVVQVDG